jgi:endonuclease III
MNSLQLPTPAMTQVLDVLEATYQSHPLGELTNHNPFKVLVGCIISLRTKDEVTLPACERLFALADTPEAMRHLPVEHIAQAIYPAGFYKTKAQTLQDLCHVLVDQYAGQTPHTIDELGHQLPAICVDVHVHRICNRLGYVQTKTPDDTEMALRSQLPLDYWQVINRLMVMHGREQCKPISPLCSTCPVQTWCLRVGVDKSR